MPDRRFRVLLVYSHPIQYSVPVLRQMAKHPRLDIQVAYCSMHGVEPGLDPEFGVEVKWDVPLLDGYPWVYVRNRSPRPVLLRFFGLINPGLWKLVRTGRCRGEVIRRAAAGGLGRLQSRRRRSQVVEIVSEAILLTPCLPRLPRCRGVLQLDPAVRRIPRDAQGTHHLHTRRVRRRMVGARGRSIGST